MKNRGFILAIDSFLVRKGMVSFLSHLQGVRVIREFNAVDPLIQYAKKHGIDFLVISQSLFIRADDLFLSKPDLIEKTIILKPDHSAEDKDEVQTSIFLSEGKMRLFRKLTILLASIPWIPEVILPGTSVSGKKLLSGWFPWDLPTNRLPMSCFFPPIR